MATKNKENKMANLKFKLTDETKIFLGTKLFRIEATASFGNVDKGDKGGFVEKRDNLSEDGNAWVYGDAWVSGNARVYGNARVSAKKSFTKGWFIGGDDTEKITRIEKELGSDYWKAQYVLGDYEINDIEQDDDVQKAIDLLTEKGKLVDGKVIV